MVVQNDLTVLIPIGPQKEYLQWLPEAIESVLAQTVQVNEILILGDGFKLDIDEIVRWWGYEWAGYNNSTKDRYVSNLDRPYINYWQSPWNIGFSPLFNCGVGLADNDLILYLASDDKLMPTCIEDCLNVWNENNQKDAWYACTYQLENGDVYAIPNNAAMVTKNLWKWMGGFPPAAFAGPDALLLSCLMAHAPDRIIKVAEGKPNYWLREHPAQETKRQFAFYAASGIMEVIRNMETQRFTPNEEIVLK